MLFDASQFSSDFLDLGEHFYSKVTPTPLSNPYWIHINPSVAKQLNTSTKAIRAEALPIVSGQTTLATQTSLAMAYAGHQFGGYSAQLGDGRALLIGQYKTDNGLLDIQLKGAGKTPYSRFGDGRAVLRSSIREYLAGEAMYALGIPTTRALCLIGSDEPILRERMETGAMVTRTARTHIRFGHFEYFYYSNQHEALRTLADYVIAHFLPEHQGNKDQYQQLFQLSVINTAKMIAKWQAVGFAHGVMNTDNMSIIGETIDYGPYGFLDDYEPHFICNHSDHHGRYAFDEQPSIGLWNLNALGHALSSLLSTEEIKNTLALYESTIISEYSQLMRAKLGLLVEEKEDRMLCSSLLGLMAEDKVDYTYCFRQLSVWDNGEQHPAISELFTQKDKINEWCNHYRQRLTREPQPLTNHERQIRMHGTNPKFIARNYLLQEAITQAENEQDHRLINTLFTLLQNPFDEHPEYEDYAKPTPAGGKHLPISCSS